MNKEVVVSLFDEPGTVDYYWLYRRELFLRIKNRVLLLKEKLDNITKLHNKQEANALLLSIIANKIQFPTKTNREEDNLAMFNSVPGIYSNKDNVKIKILDKCFFTKDYGLHERSCRGLSDNNISAMVDISFMKLINDTHCMGGVYSYSHELAHELYSEKVLCGTCRSAVHTSSCYLCLRHDDCVGNGNFIAVQDGCSGISFCMSCKDRLLTLKKKYEAYGGCLNCQVSRIIQTYNNLGFYINILDLDIIFADDFYSSNFIGYLLKCNSILLYQIGVVEDANKDCR